MQQIAGNQMVSRLIAGQPTGRIQLLKEGDQLPEPAAMAKAHFANAEYVKKQAASSGQSLDDAAASFTSFPDIYDPGKRIAKDLDATTKGELTAALMDTNLIKYLTQNYVPPDQHLRLEQKDGAWKGGLRLDDPKNISLEHQQGQSGYLQLDDQGSTEGYKDQLSSASKLVSIMVSGAILQSLPPPKVHVFTQSRALGQYRARQSGAEIAIAVDDTAATIVHEVGHYLEEHTLTSLWNDVQVLREHRHTAARGLLSRFMPRVAAKISAAQEPDPQNNAGEYTAKAYESGATEVTAMTLEYFATPERATALVRNDPLQAAIVLRPLALAEPDLQAVFKKFRDYLPNS
jgi:hypothetical protein